MGNESSRPEMPEGRSRSLSPLPRDDQLQDDGADHDMAKFPSTMPPSSSTVDRSGVTPGAPGSLAWRQRRRRSRGVSPESNPDKSRSPSPEDSRPNASQPTHSAARAAVLPRSATQPDPVASGKTRSSKRKTKKTAGEAAFDRDAAIQEFRKRRRRSTAPSPFERDDTEQPMQDLNAAGAFDDEAASSQDPSSKQTRLSKKDKGKGKEAVMDVIPEEEATTVGARSMFDFDDEPPPSAQPPVKRGRRDSGAKTRKPRKTPRSSDVAPNGGEEAENSREHLDQAALESVKGDIRANSDFEIGIPRSHSTVFKGHDLARAPSPTLPRPSSVDGSQRSHSDSGYAEPVGQALTAMRPGVGMAAIDGLPRYEIADLFDSVVDDGMSVASEPHGLPMVTDTPPSLPDEPTGDEVPSNHPEEHSNTQQNSAPVSTPLESSVKSTKPRTNAKRKLKTPFFPVEEEENARAFAELPPDDAASPPTLRRSRRVHREQSPAQDEAGPAIVAPKTKRKKAKKQPNGNAAATDDADEEGAAERSPYRSGALSEIEQNQITRAVERFREDEGLTQEALNQVIHENPQASTRPINRQLWASIQEACPSRSRRKLINWCRQRFHNFAGRGTWTREQDDELLELVTKHGKKWSYIAGLINRYQKDVRDRWRNYLVCRDTVKTDVWSEGEEERFREVVENSIEKIREGMSEDSAKPPEELLNWLTISEAMGHTRSRLQCMDKWKRMRAAEPLPAKVPTVLPSGSSWRLEKAREDLRKISVDDKYTLMLAIRDSRVGKDTKINWKQIVNDTFGGKYERQALLVTWGRLRKAVPDEELKTTRDCARYLCDMYEREGTFGGEEEREATGGASDVAQQDAASFSNHRRRKGKEVARPVSPQASHRESSSSASRGTRSKRSNGRSKTKRDSSPSHTSPTTREPADEDAVMDDQYVAPLRTTSSDEIAGQAESGQSPELGMVSPEPSPSVEAQTARSRRRDGRGSAVEDTNTKAQEKEISPATPTATSSKVLKVPKRRRRESLSNGSVDDPKSKKYKVSRPTSASKAKINGVEADQHQSPTAGGKSWSVISSDMDDMEDIPAALPASSWARR